jgi:phosphatidylglycerophosphate synthase
MIPLSQVKSKGARKNNEANNLLHFFASKFSIYFSWMFLNIGLSANQVTFVFFLMGLSGSLLFMSQSVWLILLAYALWRLHIIFDLCDGDVARFNQTFSLNGAYWDYMIHSLLYPLSFCAISLSLFQHFNDAAFVYIGLFGGIVLSLTQAVKNTYYRAMLFNKVEMVKKPAKPVTNRLRTLLRNIIVSALSYEGFLLCYLLMRFTELQANAYYLMYAFYLTFIGLIVAIKFLQFSRDGACSARS